MGTPDPRARSVLPIPDPEPERRRPSTPRTRHEVPTNRAASPARGRAQRAHRPARRRRLRRVERLRRSVPTPTCRTPRGGRPEVQPVPHDGALLADAAGAATGPQPPLGRHGRHHGDRDLGARLQLGPAEQCAPLAETLRLNGYSTAQFGKCHEVPVWETSPPGPSTLAHRGGGFEHFYGFIGGETNQYVPGASTRAPTPVEPEKRPRRATTSRRT